jgi:glycosyltransferase involved in cell wall biosynthesis
MIVEAIAMGKAIVWTTLGAEGIEAVPGRGILVENEPLTFAEAVNRLPASPGLAARIGQSPRQPAKGRYAWNEAARALECFYHQILEDRLA